MLLSETKAAILIKYSSQDGLFIILLLYTLLYFLATRKYSVIELKQEEIILAEEKKQENEFEYNDGLGDMLREKEIQEFSWAKTSIMVFRQSLIVTKCLTELQWISMSRSLLT